LWQQDSCVENPNLYLEKSGSLSAFAAPPAQTGRSACRLAGENSSLFRGESSIGEKAPCPLREKTAEQACEGVPMEAFLRYNPQNCLDLSILFNFLKATYLYFQKKWLF
jgi:hypothetical protein